MSEAEEKTENPSDHKLKTARNKGMVAKSNDVLTICSLAAAFLALVWLFPLGTKKILTFYKSCFSHKGSLATALREAFDLWLIVSLPIVFASALGAVIGNVAQFGLLFSGHPIRPDFKRINPILGMKKLWSKDRMVDLLKQTIKFAIVFSIIFFSFKEYLPQILTLYRTSAIWSFSIIAALIKAVFIKVLVGFFCIAIFDWFWSRFSFFKSMRMSKYEVKKEYQQQEGDPHLKQERRRKHQETVEGPLSPDLEKASVIITNPSHLAVALRYDHNNDETPKLLDKGIGKKAKAMRKKAYQCSIPVIRNVPLARDLHWLDIDEEVPSKLYESVAEVLLFVHELSIRGDEP